MRRRTTAPSPPAFSTSRGDQRLAPYPARRVGPPLPPERCVDTIAASEPRELGGLKRPCAVPSPTSVPAAGIQTRTYATGERRPTLMHGLPQLSTARPNVSRETAPPSSILLVLGFTGRFVSLRSLNDRGIPDHHCTNGIAQRRNDPATPARPVLRLQRDVRGRAPDRLCGDRFVLRRSTTDHRGSATSMAATRRSLSEDEMTDSGSLPDKALEPGPIHTHVAWVSQAAQRRE